MFSGYVQLTRGAAAAGDCALSVASGAQRYELAYQDAPDTADAVTRNRAVDPGSRVFNSVDAATSSTACR